jgi:hypothetical protein
MIISITSLCKLSCHYFI